MISAIAGMYEYAGDTKSNLKEICSDVWNLLGLPINHLSDKKVQYNSDTSYIFLTIWKTRTWCHNIPTNHYMSGISSMHGKDCQNIITQISIH